MRIIYYLCKMKPLNSGRQTYHCTNCKITFKRIVSQTLKSKNIFCSRTCSTVYNNTHHKKRIATQRKCKEHLCTNLISGRAKYCDTHKKVNSSYYKNKTIAECINHRIERGYPKCTKYTIVRLFSRSWFKELTKKPCANCGYALHVEICHIKPISKFPDTTLLSVVNHPTNIIQLCCNCHWELDKGLLKVVDITRSHILIQICERVN